LEQGLFLNIFFQFPSSNYFYSVAQLYVSSRVKADKNSQKLIGLGKSSKDVNKCTADLVGIVKSGQQSLGEESIFLIKFL
jgi:hypothetical protein